MIANEHAVYVRMYVYRGNAYSLAIMIDNDILQTKYVASIYIGTTTSIGDSLHIVIENVTKNMDTTLDDAKMKKEYTTVTIGSGSDSQTCSTWTSTIEPDNSKVELNCKIVENDGTIVTAKCISETTWPNSVFNRIPMWIRGSSAVVGSYNRVNRVLFGTNSFPVKGSLPRSWTQCDVSGHASNLTICEFTIMELSESFVNHWVNMGAKAFFEDGYAILISPESSQ